MFLLLGLAAGFLAGLLGIGGSLIVIGVLSWVLPGLGIPAHSAMHVAVASAVAGIIVTGMSSAWSHHRRGSVLWSTAAWMVPGLLVGAWLGTALAVRMDEALLRWVVAIYCVLAAARLRWGRVRPSVEGLEPRPRGWPMVASGGVIGALGAVVGIGGGSMTVPLLVWRGVRPVHAVGTSSACGIALAVAAAAGYALHAPAAALPQYGIGYIYLPAAIGVALASVVAAPWGARLAHWLSPQALKTTFVVFLLLTALSVAVGGRG